MRTHTSRSQAGFTLIEAVIVVAIVLTIAALAIPAIGRMRPRAWLATTTAELQSLVHQARLQALSTGRDVWVVVFPEYANGDGIGRVVVYEDGNFDFATTNAASGVDLDRMNPARPQAGPLGQVVTTMDFPAAVRFGADANAPTALAAPFAGVDLSQACSFCGNLSDHRGAIRFDPRGRASFYGRTGAAQTTAGGALHLTSSPDVPGTRTLVVAPVSGVVRLIAKG